MNKKIFVKKINTYFVASLFVVSTLVSSCSSHSGKTKEEELKNLYEDNDKLTEECKELKKYEESEKNTNLYSLKEKKTNLFNENKKHHQKFKELKEKK